MKILTPIILILISISTIAQTRLFVDPDFPSIGNNHETLAIIPFKTSISLRPKQMEMLEKGQLQAMEKDESGIIQQSLYSWFLKRKQQGKCWVDVQEITLTNATLAKNGINYA